MGKPTAITIGNFDGVHLGHVQLVRIARAAVGDDGRVVVLSFDPHPSSVLREGDVPGRLSDFAERTHLLRDAGADEVRRIQPSRSYLNQPPEEFLSALIDGHHPQVIVEGPDFRFGRGRTGSVDTLKEHSQRLGFRSIVIAPVEIALSDQSVIRASSTMIRWLLRRGRVQDAGAILGRPYELTSRVIPGDRRGRNLGVPTANLDGVETMLPADGIYSGTALREDGSAWPAAISVGTKPTFGQSSRVCEAHLLGYDGPLDEYDWTIRVRFHDWVRDQLAFASVDQLVAQLQRDIAQVRQMNPAVT